MSDAEVAALAHDAGVGLVPLSGFYCESRAARGFLLGYAGIPEADITVGLQRLAEALG
jgi:DNA-binding transcriptional MocR family regulator